MEKLSTENKQLTLKQAKLYRLACRLAFFLLSLVAPLVITGFKFRLFTQATGIKWSIVGILVIIIIAWRFKKRLSEWINTWENSNMFKWVLVGIGRTWPFILVIIVVSIFHFSETKIVGDTLFCLQWACGLELLSYLIIYPIEMKFDYMVQRMIRKNERKTDFKEVWNEVKDLEQEGNGK